MNFINFQEFKNLKGEVRDVLKYLSEELAASLRNLKTGLTKLTLSENFESFETSVTIASGATVSIRNQLRDGAIPTKRIIVRISGTTLIVDGTWDSGFVRLTNQGGVSASLTVIFLR